MIPTLGVQSKISQDISRLHQALNSEIGSHQTLPEKRKNLRHTVLQLIALEESIPYENIVALKSRIAEINSNISKPSLKLNLIHVIDREKALVEYHLTRKELEILKMLPHGLSVKEMAVELFLTESTIKSHLASIYRKLGVSNRVKAIAKARENYLLSL